MQSVVRCTSGLKTELQVSSPRRRKLKNANVMAPHIIFELKFCVNGIASNILKNFRWLIVIGSLTLVCCPFEPLTPLKTSCRRSILFKFSSKPWRI